MLCNFEDEVESDATAGPDFEVVSPTAHSCPRFAALKLGEGGGVAKHSSLTRILVAAEWGFYTLNRSTGY